MLRCCWRLCFEEIVEEDGSDFVAIDKAFVGLGNMVLVSVALSNLDIGIAGACSMIG